MRMQGRVEREGTKERNEWVYIYMVAMQQHLDGKLDIYELQRGQRPNRVEVPALPAL